MGQTQELYNEGKTMNIDPDKLQMYYGREGLHISQDGREIAVANCYDLAVMHINFGDNLDITPNGWYMSRRVRVEKWLATQKEKAKMDNDNICPCLR